MATAHEPMPRSAADFERAAILMRALDSHVRMHILYLLQQRPRCVHELVGLLQSSQPLISQHLKVLKTAALVDAERRGREMYYSLANPAVMPVLDTVIALSRKNTKASV